MYSREKNMRNVEKYIEHHYKGKRKEASDMEKEILKGNVLMTFYKDILDEKEIPYLKSGEIDLEALREIVEKISIDEAGLKPSFYYIFLSSGHIIEIIMELVTGYIMLATSADLEEGSKILSRLNDELILCRGITQEDVRKKSIIYYHYLSAKRDYIKENYVEINVED